MSSESFRGSLFGGFNRDDVASFISSMSIELNVCKTECEGLKTERKALKSEIETLSAQNSELKKEKEGRELKSAETDALKANVAELQAYIAGMQAKMEEDARAIEAFNRLKSKLSVMEFEACKRAQDIETEASKRAQEIETEASRRAQDIETVVVDKYARIMGKLTNIIDSLRLEYEEIHTSPENAVDSPVVFTLNAGSVAEESASKPSSHTEGSFFELEKMLKNTNM